jgi:hypothetical protein
MVETALNRDSEDLLPGFFAVQETNEYIVGTTGAKVTAESSIGVIVHCCNKLPKDKYGDRVSVFFFSSTHIYTCTSAVPFVFMLVWMTQISCSYMYTHVTGTSPQTLHLSPWITVMVLCVN